MLLTQCHSITGQFADLVCSSAIDAFELASRGRTCSTSLTERSEHSSITMAFYNRNKVGSKLVSSDTVSLRAGQTSQTQLEVVCDEKKGVTAIADSKTQEPASVQIGDALHQPDFKSYENTLSSGEPTVPAKIVDDAGTQHTVSDKPLRHSDAYVNTSSLSGSSGSPPPDQPSLVGAQKAGNVEPIVKSSDSKVLRSSTASVPRWRTTVAYEANSMGCLGKNRFLIRQMPVPSEASARFARIKETLEADVTRLITGMKSNSQILWSYRLCMIGVKSGNLVTAEPTLLISCGSSRGKRKIKGSFLRIRPHYLESLGMSFIVRYDKSAPVLAGLTEVPFSDNYKNEGEESIVTYLQWEPSMTSCGLKLMFEFPRSETTRRSYATLGGVIRLGGVCYGVTTAHPIFDSPSKYSGDKMHGDLESMSDSSVCSDSSDDEDFQQIPSHSPIMDSFLTHQDLQFVRLVGNSTMSYSFNGGGRSISGLVVQNAAVSDWAVLQIPETYIKPNLYLDPSQKLEDGIVQPVSVNSIASSSLMEAGPVHILCTAKAPHVGFLSMNLVSLQLNSGALEVLEVFLEKPVYNGISGSWVVKKDQLVGIVVAISDAGRSCLVVPAWKLFEDIQAVCNQKIQLLGSTPSFESTSPVAGPIPLKQPVHVRFESDRIPPTSAGISAQRAETRADRYDELLLRLTYNQELIAKTLSKSTTPGPLLGRFLVPDERSEAFSSFSDAQQTWEEAFEIKRPTDSLSQGSTIVAAREQFLEKEGGDVYVETALPTQILTEEDLLAHIQSPAWTSLAPAMLRALLNRHDVTITNIASLSLPQDLGPSNTILECYDINAKGVASRLHSNNGASKFASWSALTVNNDAMYGDSVVGKMVISKDPTSLHLAALHLVLSDDFDMHSILHTLVDDSPSKSHMKGYIEPEIAKQRSFLFSFKYHCIIGDNCKPLPWQKHNQSSTASENGLSLSNCSAIVALSLSGGSKQSMRRRSHRDQPSTVHIFDPFGSWKLLKIQCFPDQVGNLHDYESDSKFANGPEAFLLALLSEYRDATSRFRDLHQKISDLVLPSVS